MNLYLHPPLLVLLSGDRTELSGLAPTPAGLCSGDSALKSDGLCSPMLGDISGPMKESLGSNPPPPPPPKPNRSQRTVRSWTDPTCHRQHRMLVRIPGTPRPLNSPPPPSSPPPSPPVYMVIPPSTGPDPG